MITVALSGDLGKPRPAIIIQADEVETASVLVCLCTSDTAATAEYRVSLEPTPSNGLRLSSIIQSDKIHAVVRAKCGPVIGRLTASEMESLDIRVAFVLGLGATSA